MDRHLRKFISLIIISLFSLFLLYMIYPFLIPIAFAIIIAYILNPIYKKVNEQIEIPTISAFVVMIGILLILVIPISLMGSVIYNQVSNLDVNLENFETFEAQISQITGIDFSISQSIDYLNQILVDNIRNYSQSIISFTSSFALSAFIFFFVLFYTLTQREMFLKLATHYMPFSKKNSQYVLTQTGYAIRALLIGQVLVAIIQGVLGMISFIIAGVEGAIFWGIVMIILSLIPVVGAFLVWIPVGLFLFYQGEVGMAIFVLLWGAIVVSQIDNIIRPKLVNSFFKLHPILIIIGVFAGLSFFGVIGLVLGPLVFAIFILLLETYEKEYMSKNV